MAPLLEIRDLRVVYDVPRGALRAVDGLTLAIEPGETYALVGESGCGKTAAALSILRLVEPGRIESGSIRFEGQDLLRLTERALRRVRGGRIGMAFQEPGAALNPVMRVGAQIVEAIRAHRRVGRREAWAEAERLLAHLALPDPARQARAYPHELSGGMKQRVMLAIALAASPALLVADEPTSALDVTVQAQILALLRRLKAEMGLTVLLITHDLGVVAENATRVGVLYAGRLVEEGPVESVFRDPAHPYTRALLRAVPGAAPPHAGSGGPSRFASLPGSVPDPLHPPPGCRFHPRCDRRFEPCDRVVPRDLPAGPRHHAACHLLETLERPA
jgi:peptide/nickel transport system ATP-binding protein